ncbi:MAG: hypothetical protein IKA47_09500 [Oscillospiraceae bacterium]|nr:hypothetical protein [Oscillospiraceae bacterium]
MKKNVMMRLASFLLVAVLISTSAISGTYAKYVTADNGSDDARVAKWGVAVEAKNFGMFEADYKTDDTTATFSGDYSVSSALGDRDDLLAPGTSGSFADIKITGTPEVAVDVKIVPTVNVSDNWIVETEFYCPVYVKVGAEEFCGLDYDSADAFEAAIAKALTDKSAQYAPNTNLADIYNNTNLDLAWRWEFEGSTINSGKGHVEQTDVKDTALGDLAVNADLTISIGVEITVTQID